MTNSDASVPKVAIEAGVRRILTDDDNHTFADWAPEVNVDTMTEALAAYILRLLEPQAIPHAAVEAAARAIFEGESDLNKWDWPVAESDREQYRGLARAALEAALPLLVAAA